MADVIFYSWQHDLPNATNRGFIQTALEAATKTIREDDSIHVEPVVDRDTAGVPGSPDIASTILAKIDQAQVFVCDVSIINNAADMLLAVDRFKLGADYLNDYRKAVLAVTPADVQAMGRTFTCKVYDTAQPGVKVTAYLNDAIPGGVVKLVVTNSNGMALTFVLSTTDVK